PQDRYTNFVNNVQQNIVINIIEKQNPSELESSFKTFISFIENIVENISVGNQTNLLYNWEEKVKLSLDITQGVKSLRKQGSLHLNLRSANILQYDETK
ncbi:1058_t:CDS:2, partial [Funneliformis geosporum]